MLDKIRDVLEQIKDTSQYPDNGYANSFLLSAVEATLEGHKPRTNGSTLDGYPIKYGDCEACTSQDNTEFYNRHAGVQGIAGLQYPLGPNGRNVKFPCPIVLKIAKAWGIE